ncbi:hypothetical protein Y032_0558g3414 [Ancylostoma ceylanicum]|nr:hypothetical protein Y032_0558g3414 [Ancylostoma ceylanicum]
MKRLLLIEGCPSERCTHIPGNDKGVSEAYYFLTYISEIGGISGGCALIPNEDSGDDNSVKAGFFISPQHTFTPSEHSLFAWTARSFERGPLESRLQKYGKPVPIACLTATLSLRPFPSKSSHATDPTPTCYPTQMVWNNMTTCSTVIIIFIHFLHSDGVAVEYATSNMILAVYFRIDRLLHITQLVEDQGVGKPGLGFMNR